MANEYVSLELLKDALKLDPDDDSRDALLNLNREAASRRIDNTTGRRFWLDTVATERSLAVRGRTRDGKILIPDVGELVTVSTGWSGTYYERGTETYEAYTNADGDTEWAITGLISVGSGWGLQNVRINAKWGWPAIPPTIQQAAVLQAIRLATRPDSPEGITGGAEWGAISVARADPDVRDLIKAYVLPGIG